MCGIIGIVSDSPASPLIHEALMALQHRGQHAAGIATSNGQKLYLQKKNGLVRHIFNSETIDTMQGSFGIGHVRYPTAGALDVENAQPFYVNYPYGIAIAHNGHLINTDFLHDELTSPPAYRHINTTSDSEILLNLLSFLIEKNKSQLSSDTIFKICSSIFQYCFGGYAVVTLIHGHGLLAFRDSRGIRPLSLGARNTPKGKEYMLSSESSVLQCMGFTEIRDVMPGEVIYINNEKQLFSKQCAKHTALTPCLFEYIYLARPDSIIDNISVHDARLHMGRLLAKKIKKHWDPKTIDVVIPIPESGRIAAIELAVSLKLPYREGFVKNSYVGRTFMMASQQSRMQSVRRKLNAISSEFYGKNVLLVDDSIVRGTTSKIIVELAKKSGANKIYFASMSPVIRYPNIYGIDMPTTKELIAHNKTLDEVKQYIGADELIYQDLKSFITVMKSLNPRIKNFESSVFDGIYFHRKSNQVPLKNLFCKKKPTIIQ